MTRRFYLNLSVLRKTWSSEPGGWRTPEDTPSFSDFHTHLTKTRLRARVIIHAAQGTAVTGDAVRETPVAKLAAITFVPSKTFLTRTLTWPLPWGRKQQHWLNTKFQGLKQGLASANCNLPPWAESRVKLTKQGTLRALTQPWTTHMQCPQLSPFKWNTMQMGRKATVCYSAGVKRDTEIETHR